MKSEKELESMDKTKLKTEYNEAAPEYNKCMGIINEMINKSLLEDGKTVRSMSPVEMNAIDDEKKLSQYMRKVRDKFLSK